MVILGQWAGRPVSVSIKANCITLSIESGGQAAVFSWDLAGRPWTALVEGVSYRRGLDGKIVAKWGEGLVRERRWLGPAEAAGVEGQARAALAGLLDGLASGAVRLAAPLPPGAGQAFERAAGFDAARAAADVAHFHQVYRPVGILPPDQYMAVVLQAAEGCAFNTCTFCNFYKDRPFRIRGPEAFAAHAQAVYDFLGAGLSLRRTIFLGDANALVIPMSRLLPLVEVVHACFDVEQLGGIYAFLDGFSAGKKSRRDWAALAERGLQRVYVGLESGSDRLLAFLKKPGKAGDAVRAVHEMKAGGVAAGVIVLLGAGGQAYAAEHVRATIAALNAMRLDLDDLIYFSELVTSEGLPYVQDAYQAGLRPLGPAERAAQGEAIAAGLRFSAAGGVPHISRYDVREFVY